jgi:3-phosphoshikimate 1-carboxyvinyltransferase
VTELNRLGIDAECTESGMRVTGGRMHGGRVATYDDHRIAMSFAMAGMQTAGIVIEDETCVRKSFPDFWEVFETL